MATIIIPSSSQALTVNGGSDGSVTVASTAGMLPGTRVFLSATGQTTVHVIVDLVASATVVFVKLIRDHSYTRFDCSAYTTASTATLTVPRQLVMDQSPWATNTANLGGLP